MNAPQALGFYEEWIWLMVSAIGSSLPPLLVASYNQNGRLIMIAVSLLSYVVTILSYVKLFKGQEIGNLFAITKVISILIVLTIGYFYFNEKVDVNTLIGIILAFVSLYFLA